MSADKRDVTAAAQAPTAAGPSRYDPRYERRIVILLTVGFGLVGLDRWVIADVASASTSTLLPDLGVAPASAAAAIGTMIAALGLAWGVSAVFSGGLSDRFGRKTILVPALVGFSLLSGASGLVSSLSAMVLLRAAMGVFEGAFCPTSFATVAEASLPSRRGFNLGLQQSAFALFGLGFGPIIATQLLDHLSWRWVFAIVGIPGLAVAFLALRMVREPVRTALPSSPDAVTQRKWRTILAHRNVPLGMATLVCAMCGIFVISAFVPSYLTGYLGMPPKTMGIVASAVGFGGAAGQWMLCAMSDRFGRRTMAVTGFVVGSAFLLAFALVGNASPGLLFVLLFVSSAFAFGLLSLITGPIAAESAPTGMIASTAGAIVGMGEMFGGGIAPIVAGGIAGGFGVRCTLWMALAGLVVGAILSLFLVETAPGLVHGAEDAFPDLITARSEPTS